MKIALATPTKKLMVRQPSVADLCTLCITTVPGPTGPQRQVTPVDSEDSVTTSPCSHHFHAKCFYAQIDSYDEVCPVCKKVFEELIVWAPIVMAGIEEHSQQVFDELVKKYPEFKGRLKDRKGKAIAAITAKNQAAVKKYKDKEKTGNHRDSTKNLERTVNIKPGYMHPIWGDKWPPEISPGPSVRSFSHQLPEYMREPKPSHLNRYSALNLQASDSCLKEMRVNSLTPAQEDEESETNEKEQSTDSEEEVQKPSREPKKEQPDVINELNLRFGQMNVAPFHPMALSTANLATHDQLMAIHAHNARSMHVTNSPNLVYGYPQMNQGFPQIAYGLPQVTHVYPQPYAPGNSPTSYWVPNQMQIGIQTPNFNGYRAPGMYQNFAPYPQHPGDLLYVPSPVPVNMMQHLPGYNTNINYVNFPMYQGVYQGQQIYPVQFMQPGMTFDLPPRAPVQEISEEIPEKSPKKKSVQQKPTSIEVQERSSKSISPNFKEPTNVKRSFEKEIPQKEPVKASRTKIIFGQFKEEEEFAPKIKSVPPQKDYSKLNEKIATSTNLGDFSKIMSFSHKTKSIPAAPTVTIKSKVEKEAKKDIPRPMEAPIKRHHDELPNKFSSFADSNDYDIEFSDVEPSTPPVGEPFVSDTDSTVIRKPTSRKRPEFPYWSSSPLTKSFATIAALSKSRPKSEPEPEIEVKVEPESETEAISKMQNRIQSIANKFRKASEHAPTPELALKNQNTSSVTLLDRPASSEFKAYFPRPVDPPTPAEKKKPIPGASASMSDFFPSDKVPKWASIQPEFMKGLSPTSTTPTLSTPITPFMKKKPPSRASSGFSIVSQIFRPLSPRLINLQTTISLPPTPTKETTSKKNIKKIKEEVKEGATNTDTRRTNLILSVTELNHAIRMYPYDTDKTEELMNSYMKIILDSDPKLCSSEKIKKIITEYYSGLRDGMPQFNEYDIEFDEYDQPILKESPKANHAEPESPSPFRRFSQSISQARKRSRGMNKPPNFDWVPSQKKYIFDSERKQLPKFNADSQEDLFGSDSDVSPFRAGVKRGHHGRDTHTGRRTRAFRGGQGPMAGNRYANFDVNSNTQPKGKK